MRRSLAQVLFSSHHIFIGLEAGMWLVGGGALSGLDLSGGL